MIKFYRPLFGLQAAKSNILIPGGPTLLNATVVLLTKVNFIQEKVGAIQSAGTVFSTQLRKTRPKVLVFSQTVSKNSILTLTLDYPSLVANIFYSFHS